MSTEKTGVGKFLVKIGTAIIHFLTGVKDEAEIIYEAANNILNGLKTFAASPEGQIIEATIESFVPASFLTELTTVILPKIFIGLGIVKEEIGAPLSKIVIDGFDALAKLDPDIKIAQMNSINALIAVALGSAQGITIPIQQALTVAQPVHAPVAGITEVTITAPEDTSDAPTAETAE